MDVMGFLLTPLNAVQNTVREAKIRRAQIHDQMTSIACASNEDLDSDEWWERVPGEDEGYPDRAA